MRKWRFGEMNRIKEILALLLVTVLLVSGCNCGKPQEENSAADGAGQNQAEAVATEPTEVELTVIHFNDFHAMYHSIARTEEDGNPRWGGPEVMAGYINELRDDCDNSIVLFGGDMFLPTPFDKLSEGETMLKIFNRFGIDAAVVGNHEFDYGSPRLQELHKKADFPWLAANVLDRDGAPIFPTSTVLEVDDLSILVIGLFPISGAQYWEDETGLWIETDIRKIVKDVIQFAEDAAEKDGEDIDLTIILSHLGLEDDKELSRRLRSRLGVDLIVGGHSHTAIEELDEDLRIPIVQAGSNGEYIGRLELIVDAEDNSITEIVDYELLPTYEEEVDPDERIRSMVEDDLDELKDFLEPITTTTSPLSFSSRTEETPLGNFAVDVLVDHFDVDLAFISSKGLRRAIPGPEINALDLREAFPFAGELIKITMDGAAIKEMISYYMNQRPDRVIAIPYNLEVRYDQSGSNYKITEVLYEGKAIEDEREYTAIVGKWLASSFQQYYDAKIVETVTEDAAQIYIDYLSEQEEYTPGPLARRLPNTAEEDEDEEEEDE